MERFLLTLHRQNFSPLGEDKLLLKGVRDNGFSVKLMYKGLDHSLAIEFPYCSVWNSTVPPKIGFLAWEASWGKCLCWINLNVVEGLLLIDVFCVRRKRRL